MEVYFNNYTTRVSIKKCDIVMWCLDPEQLDTVLRRINKVIPKKIVGQRLLINDHCQDGTPMVAHDNGWEQIINEGHGISDAANTALKHIKTDWFISIEQDVLLSPDWWQEISNSINSQNIAAISGVRFLPKNHLCYNIEPYNFINQAGYGKTLDNTLWNTKILRHLGGFPKLKYAGHDTFLAEWMKANDYEWIVNNVQSLHLHKGFYSELKRYFLYGRSLPELYREIDFSLIYKNIGVKSLLIKLLKSPVSGLKMSWKMKDIRLMISYPHVRLFWLLGYLRGKMD